MVGSTPVSERFCRLAWGSSSAAGSMVQPCYGSMHHSMLTSASELQWNPAQPSGSATQWPGPEEASISINFTTAQQMPLWTQQHAPQGTNRHGSDLAHHASSSPLAWHIRQPSSTKGGGACNHAAAPPCHSAAPCSPILCACPHAPAPTQHLTQPRPADPQCPFPAQLLHEPTTLSGSPPPTAPLSHRVVS